MTNKQNLLEIRLLKNNKPVKVKKRTVKLILEIAKQWAKDYSDYYYIPTLCETFNGKYAYFYKDLFSEKLIIVTPDNFDKRLQILKENAKKLNLEYALFIGFYVPDYE